MNSIEIDVHSVKRLIDSEADFLLLDCRETSEHRTCRVEGATLIPMREIPLRVVELEEFRDKPIVVLCHHGVRSLRVAHWLRDQGLETAQSMQGGIETWSLEVDPSIPRY